MECRLLIGTALFLYPQKEEHMKNDLLVKIARCNELITAKTNKAHACYALVNGQDTTEFHIPEPWNGHIDTAQILFISSNPSIDKNEHYPTCSWSNTAIIDFFENRFENTSRDKWSRYWKAINKWIGWIFRENKNENLLSKYACLAEIVHCKSPTDTTLSHHCQKTCFNNHLRDILKLFGGKYIVVVGRIAREYIQTHLDEEYLHGKKIAYVPAPRAFGHTDEERKNDLLKQLL